MKRPVMLGLLLLVGCATEPTGSQFCYAADTAHTSGLGGSTQLCLGYP